MLSNKGGEEGKSFDGVKWMGKKMMAFILYLFFSALRGLLTGFGIVYLWIILFS